MKPILFNTDMVRDILEGRKTVTRRVVKPQPQESETNPHRLTSGCYYFDVPSKRFPGDLDRIVGPYWPPYQPGDILWVRETWQFIPCIDCGLHVHGGCTDTPITYEDRDSVGEGCFVYRADYPEPQRVYWKPSIHMPRDAARIFLRVKGVRVERLQDCGNEQAKDEGCVNCSQFVRLWNSTIKPADRTIYGWDANPWVWVIQFERAGEIGP